MAIASSTAGNGVSSSGTVNIGSVPGVVSASFASSWTVSATLSGVASPGADAVRQAVRRPNAVLRRVRRQGLVPFADDG